MKFDVDRVKSLRFDAVFISHHHDDHCSLDSLNLLDRRTPIFLYCAHEELFSWIRELGFESVHPLRLNEVTRVGPLEIVPLKAFDAEVDSMFQVRGGGANVLNVVDSMIDDEGLPALADRGPWDLVLWPFQTMRELDVIAPRGAVPADGSIPEEWIAQLQALKPRFVVPGACQFRLEEWSWYNHAFFPISYEGFRRQIEGILPETRVVRMNPSCSFTIERDELKPAPSLDWIRPIGEWNVDYEYRPELSPPPTSDIARRFRALSEEEARRAREYCEVGILERYRSLGAPTESYFNSKRTWRLTVYDHEGKGVHHHYEIEGGGIRAVPAREPSWTTEVIATKLHAALFSGETLTSMYLRINDDEFSEEIESEVRAADVVADPLIRCLFTDVFCAYQKEQLARLRGGR